MDTVMADKQGFFLTIEGIEGVGKSTNIEFIQNWLKAKDIEPVMTREPGGTPLAEEIRELLLTPKKESMSNLTELLLVFAARAQHLQSVITPSLNNNQWVVSDRFTDATYAYQGGGRSVNIELIAQMETLVQGSLRPDAVIILDAPFEVSQARVSDRGQQKDRFEQEQRRFFEATRAMYLQRAQQMPERYFVIDASASLASVQEHIEQALNSCFKRWKS